MIRDYFELAYEGIKNRKLRSYLTMLGIIIGIAFIVVMVSLGEGLRITVLEQLRMFGTDLVMVFPGAETTAFLGMMGGLRLSESDTDAVEDVRGVDSAESMILKTLTVEYKGEKRPVLICGHPPDELQDIFEASQGWRVHNGRWLEEGKHEFLVGFSLAKDGFDKEMGVGDKVTIEGQKFKTVGIIHKVGERTMDSTAHIPLDVLRDLTKDKEGVDTIIAQVSPGSDLDSVAEEIKDKLRDNRNVKEGEEDFTVITNEQAGDVVGNVLGILELVLIGLTFVALIIGGIGIMNTMYTSVLERTREVGVMKALGAKDKHVMLIFLIESGIYGLVGGGIGVLIGIIIGKLTEVIARDYLGYTIFQVSITLWLVVGALAFSFVIGCISGIAPARKAAALEPVDALRYE